MELMFKNYTRLAYIDTGRINQKKCREYAQENARALGLRYEEIPGETSMIKKMINSPWDDDFVVIQPGEKLNFEDFGLIDTGLSN